MSRKWMKSWAQIAVLVLVAAAVAACVWRTEHKIETVSRIDAHIVLDIRQIKDEAGQVEGYVRGDSNQYPDLDKEKPSSSLRSRAPEDRLAWLTWLDPAATAHAQEAAASDESSVTPEQEKAAIQARRDRAPKIDQALTKNYIGENDRGYVESLLPKDPKDSELTATIQKLIKDENADRRTIYRAFLERKGLKKDALPTIESAFASAIREKLKKGQSFQAPRDKKLFQEFADSKLGKDYAGAKPGQWLKKLTDPASEK